MRKYIFIIISLIFWGFASGAGAAEAPKPEKTPVLTDEDKEVVKHLELLELMKVLKEMELLKEYDLFTGEESNEKDN